VKKEEWRKIKTIHWKFKRNFKPKIRKSHLGWVSLNCRHASPLIIIFPRWIRVGNTSCAGPTCRTCAG
jgi:hypothetical protein